MFRILIGVYCTPEPERIHHDVSYNKTPPTGEKVEKLGPVRGRPTRLAPSHLGPLPPSSAEIGPRSLFIRPPLHERLIEGASIRLFFPPQRTIRTDRSIEMEQEQQGFDRSRLPTPVITHRGPPGGGCCSPQQMRTIAADGGESIEKC
ncbi:hypothetical protein GWI33_011248 [Rhynchophorus ferrugineus]|uniref:Uncharacterized protein n=1 Tax=Rhynchophorus ferrugineus TaxID=354439 RepID=A0A834I7B1_RHYFE|nr:hypothetical protein GWI33_011248 [Rhynchophorus ferrugineus]